MKVHFASGEHPFAPPWWNVDYHVGDQQADLLQELPDNLVNIEFAYVGHFLEHLTPNEGVGLLHRIRLRMAPGGRLLVVGPDVDKGRALLIPEQLSRALGAHGFQSGPGGADRSHCHLWDCTADAVMTQAKAASWLLVAEFPISELPVLFPEVPVISLAAWQLAVTAIT